MSLESLIDNLRSDKNTTHSYLSLYQDLLNDKKESARTVLEVGIYNGGSIKLWDDFFTNATVYALDIMDYELVWDKLKNNEKIKIFSSTDAYDESIFNSTFLDKGITFDFMLDDGPHTLESMKQFIKLYSKLMTDDGILIIEDVQSIDWIQILTDVVPEHLKKYIMVYDLRDNKGRYDDIVFSINKTNEKR